MPIHDLGYRKWGVTPDPVGMRWLVIAQTGISNAWKNLWLRRMMFFAWLPATGFGLVFFLYEQLMKQLAAIPDGTKQLFVDLVLWKPDRTPGAPPVGIQFQQQIMQLLEGGDPGILQAFPANLMVPIIGGLKSFQLDWLNELLFANIQNPDVARHDFWAQLILLFFRYPQAYLMVLIVGLVAPRLIAQDFRSRAFLLYFSRPIAPYEYVLGKAAIIWVYLALITTVPALVLYLLGIGLSPTISVVTATWTLPLRILLASLVLIIPTTSLALCFSSLTSESRYAGYMWFAVWILGWVLWFVMTSLTMVVLGSSSARSSLDSLWKLASLYHTLADVQRWVFGLGTFKQVLPSLVSLMVLTLLSWSILMRRVTAPLRQ